jgi:hypothetical protein
MIVEKKIQLKHPDGKKAPSIATDTYDAICKSLIGCLTRKKKATYAAMVREVGADFKISKTKFRGSLQWYVEWVRLDLEAKGTLKKIPKTSPQQFTLSKI